MTRFNVSRFVKGTPFFNERYTKRGNVPFLSKMVYQRLKVWTSGPSLPVRNVVEKPPPGPLGHLKVGGKKRYSIGSGERFSLTSKFFITCCLFRERQQG